MEGRSGLYPKKHFTSYPSSLRLAAVEDYLGGGGSLDAMCRKYRISSHAVLQQWITLYMEGFWGILKSEMYYLQQFHTFEELKKAIDEYMDFYNTRRLQAKFCLLYTSDAADE